MDIDQVTGQIIDASITVHMRIGPGLLESVYQVLLASELTRRGLHVERNRQVVFEYDGITFSEGLRVDMLVNDLVIVELKSVEALAPVHAKQLLTYLRLLNKPVGLLVNFGGSTVKEGLRRVVNNYRPKSPHLRDSRSSATPRELSVACHAAKQAHATSRRWPSHAHPANTSRAVSSATASASISSTVL